MSYYLAYGSNLHPVRVRARVPSARCLGVVKVEAARLEFCKRSEDGSGKCTMTVTGDSRDTLYGALYEFDAAEKRDLDKMEASRGLGYRCEQIDVSCGGREYQGVFVYLANPAYINRRLAPYHEYKAIVIEGARYHGFPADYINRISNLVSWPNPDPVKRARDKETLKQLRKGE